MISDVASASRCGITPEPRQNHQEPVGGSQTPHALKERGVLELTSEPQSKILITLPWKVIVRDNERHAILRVGQARRIGLTSRYRESLVAAALLAAQQWRQPALKGSVSLTITMYEPDKRRRDVGNYIKFLADALIRVAFVDDSQIDELTVRRGPQSKDHPRAELEIVPT